MIFQGSKAKLREYIVPILQGCIDEHGITEYVEPFVGGANIIDHIKCKYREGFDNNPELIALLRYMQDDPELSIAPEHCDFDHYKDVRDSRKTWQKCGAGKYTTEYTALIGYFASYGGRYFDGGYGRDSKGGREIYAERLEYARKQAPLLSGIKFDCYDYRLLIDCLFSKKGVMYLDPPYRGTKSYCGKTFDHDEFYDFARFISDKWYVFISEFDMPQDFQCIWSKKRKLLQKSDRKAGEVAVEKLFVIGLSAEWIKNKKKI